MQCMILEAEVNGISTWLHNERLEGRQRRWCELRSNLLKHQLQFVKLSYSSQNRITFVFGYLNFNFRAGGGLKMYQGLEM